MATDATSPSSINFGYHLVVYIDLPGQRRELEAIRHVPQTDAEKQATIRAIDRSAMRVHAIRSDLTHQARNLMQINPEVLKQLPPELRDSFLRFRSVNIKHVGFSDTFVVAVSLAPGTEPEGRARAITAVWAILAGTAAISMLAMARQIPLRGGMTVGTAIDLFENEAYGAALMDAYRLESTIAEYNRIVIGPELFDYLDEIEQLPQDSYLNKYSIERARKCRELICLAPDDNLPMVHMLSPFVMNLPTRSGGTWAQLRVRAREWVHAEAQKFADDRDYKLSGRYARLLRYLDAYEPAPPVPVSPVNSHPPPRQRRKRKRRGK
jgi:hypothetical protein